MFVAFTHDLVEHARHLAEIAGDWVQVEQRPFAIAELQATEARLLEDSDVLSDLGFQWIQMGGVPSAGRIEVEVIGPAGAEAAARLFAERYGPIVQTEWLGPGRTREVPHPFGSWMSEGDLLRVYFGLDHNGEELAGTAVTQQDAAQVVVAITRSEPVGPTTMIGGFQACHADLQLEHPLGRREVIDASCGERRPSLAELRSAAAGTSDQKA